jgi:peptidoglycan/LPS O-acetylase OafA/YrhL
VHDARPNFRPDIQGLRALAILLVVACHAGLPGFAGAYIGVDIFFVISGYLITGLLYRELQQHNQIDLVGFYARRCKRLLPALSIVFITTLLIARYVLSPYEQLEQLVTAHFVPLWLSNVHFSLSGLEYFAPESSTNLFLHTWSLGVEEQFYLLWPLLLTVLAARQISSPGGNTSARKRLIYGLASLTVGGFLLWALVNHLEPLYAFYLMPARVWQFASGGLVFLMVQNSSVGKESSGRYSSSLKLNLLLGPVGLMLIALSVFLFDEGKGNPVLLILLPTLGAALLLWNGTTGNTGVSRLLGTGFMRWTGDISYSWYLWHWPVLILGIAVLGPAGSKPWIMPSLVMISLLMANLSFLLIESPFRQSIFLTKQPVFTLAISVSLMAGLFISSQAMEKRARVDTNDESLLPYINVRNDLSVIYSMGCDDWYRSAKVYACAFGNQDAARTAVLMGDSIGAQWVSALAPRFIAAGWQFIVYTKSACPIVEQPIFYPAPGVLYENCNVWRSNVLAEVAELAPEVVFLGSSTNYAFSSEQWTQGTVRVLDGLGTPSGNVFVIMGTMVLPFNGLACLERRAWQPEGIRGFNPCSAFSESPIDSEVRSGLLAAVDYYPYAKLLDFNPLVCPRNICSAERGGQAIYRDATHLADGFVASLTEQVFELIRVELEGRESPLQSLWTGTAEPAP